MISVSSNMCSFPTIFPYAFPVIARCKYSRTCLAFSFESCLLSTDNGGLIWLIVDRFGLLLFDRLSDRSPKIAQTP